MTARRAGLVSKAKNTAGIISSRYDAGDFDFGAKLAWLRLPACEGAGELLSISAQSLQYQVEEKAMRVRKWCARSK